MTEQKWSRSTTWVGTKVEDSYVLLDVEGGEYLTLNATAADIWSALEQPATSESLTDLLVQKYQVGHDECRSSVDAMIEHFHSRGLLESPV